MTASPEPLHTYDDLHIRILGFSEWKEFFSCLSWVVGSTDPDCFVYMRREIRIQREPLGLVYWDLQLHELLLTKTSIFENQ